MLVHKKITIGKYNNIQEKHPEWTYRKIANYFDCSDTTIRLFVRKNNLIYKSKKNGLKYSHSFESIRDYIKLNPKATQNQIIKHFHVSYNKIKELYGWDKLGYIGKSRENNK